MGGRTYRIVLYGLGGVGSAVARIVARKTSIRIVAAVDTDPAKIGRDVADIPGLDAPTGVIVAAALPPRLEADLAIQASTPDLPSIAREIEALAARKLNVVSVSGAFYTAASHPDIARRIDEAARGAGVSVYATGATPGFFSDVLPSFVTRACARVDSVHVKRTVNMSQWGTGIYDHYGIGWSKDRFDAAAADGSLKLFDRLGQSVDYLAAALGWTLERRDEQKAGFPSATRRQGNGIVVEPGRICGFSHKHLGIVAGAPSIVVDYTAIVGLDPALDGEAEQTRITIVGDPGIVLDISGDVLSDPKSIYQATAATAVNSVAHVVGAAPGLLRPDSVPVLTPAR